jgi:putative ABC transport system permease protein
MKLLLKLVQKDFKRNKVITTALAIFLILSAIFMAGGLRVAGIMSSSMKGLNELAVPPDYLQMHKGTYDEDAYQNFIETHDYIKDSLIVKMLNIRNSNIIINGKTLEKYLMENGFVVQNEGFDFLLNTENQIAVVEKGEVGVPVYYVEELGVEVGDTITLQEGDYSKELTVTTIIRDSTMNTALATSKRFLISQADHDEISLHMGKYEYLFEFLLEDGTSTSVLEADYKDAKMPSNGVVLSGKAITLINAFSYGLIAYIIIAISFLLIMIAVLCLSYIIRATMAEENYTIGEMKAIGFSGKAIEKLYQIKYIMLIVVAVVIGYLAAIPFGKFFSSSVILYCGNGVREWMKWVFSFIGVILLGLIVMHRCHRIIRKNLKSTVMELMRGEEKKKKEGHYSLPSAGLKHRNLTIALGELKCKWKEYFVIFLVFVFSSFLILFPMNMRSTVNNPSFMTYMGVGECDIRIDIQYNENLMEQKEAAQTYLENDSEIETYAIYQNGYVEIKNADGEFVDIRVQSGDESIFPLEYLNGSAPAGSQEIALSYLNANELGKKVGDSITIVYKEEEHPFIVSGIYQDITYGGMTAKAGIYFDVEDVEVYIIYVDVKDGVSFDKKTDELRSILSDSKITQINEFISQTLVGVMDNMSLVEGASISISIVLSMLITVLFLQLITAKEHSAIAIKKAIGFTNRDLRIQFGIRILIIQVIAIFIGTLLSKFLGEIIFGFMLSSMGASKITMLINPITAYLICPVAQLLVVFLTVMVGTKVVRKYHIRNQIME